MIDTNKLYEIFADKIISLTNKDNWLLLFPCLSFTRANSIEIVFSSNTYDWSCGHIENPVLVKLINQDPYEAGTYDVCGSFEKNLIDPKTQRGTYDVCGSFVVAYDDLMDFNAFSERLDTYMNVKANSAIRNYLKDFSDQHLDKLSIDQQLKIAANADDFDDELANLILKYANKE